MNLEIADQTKKDDQNFHGGWVRLYNSLLPKPASFEIDRILGRVDTPAKRGIDIRTCTFNEGINYLGDPTIKKSESQRWIIERALCLRFETEYAQSRDRIHARDKMEFELVQANRKNEMEWLGAVDYHNNVRLDGSLSTLGVRKKISRDGTIKFVRKSS